MAKKKIRQIRFIKNWGDHKKGDVLENPSVPTIRALCYQQKFAVLENDPEFHKMIMGEKRTLKKLAQDVAFSEGKTVETPDIPEITGDTDEKIGTRLDEIEKEKKAEDEKEEKNIPKKKK
jgi:hypothetical protein